MATPKVPTQALPQIMPDDRRLVARRNTSHPVADQHLPATFIYAGIDVERCGVFTGTRGRQLAGRCGLISTGAFPYRDEWAQLIAALEATLRLHGHEPGALAAQGKYLHQRTGGMIGSLTHLIRGAAIRAILGGQEESPAGCWTPCASTTPPNRPPAGPAAPPVTPNLNPARLARFTAWVTTLPPRPLPRTAIPVPGEYHLDYVARLADANHLKFPELTAALDDTAAITLHGPRGWKQHEQERLAAAAGQPLARIARVLLPIPAFTCATPRASGRRCTPPATGAPPATASPAPSPATCRRTRPSAAATGSGQARPPAATPASSTSALPRGPPRPAPPPPAKPPSVAMGGRGPDATGAILHALRGGTCIPGQTAVRQLAPAPGSRPWPARRRQPQPGKTTAPAHAAVEIAIYPDVRPARRPQPQTAAK